MDKFSIMVITGYSEIFPGTIQLHKFLNGGKQKALQHKKNTVHEQA